MQNLVNGGCSKIILACNTSHLFLPSIYEKVPFLEDKVVDIIKNCVHIIKQNNIETIHLLGSEGTIESKVYQSLLNENGIKCTVPMNEEYGVLRECIEAVKQNKYTEDIGSKFCNLVNGHESVILGCTELPILYDKYNENINCENIFDPLFLSLQQLKRSLTMNKILTFGVYDCLHLGHLRLFKQCKKYGDYLIVAVQNGDYIRKFKPDAKVLYSTDERVEMLEALRIVDKVVVYDTVSIEALEKIDFSILALGEDHKGGRFDEVEEWCNQNGKKIVRLKRTPGICSSDIKKSV